MLRSANELKGYKIDAIDGEIGKCIDFMFDQENWIIRFMVADTGTWFKKEKVLLCTFSLGTPDWVSQTFPVKQTILQIKQALHIDDDETITGKYEKLFLNTYNYPLNWFSSVTMTSGNRQIAGVYMESGEKEKDREEISDDSVLISEDDLVGYDIEAVDGKIGHVEDIILEDDSWRIRYVVIDTMNLLPGGKKILVSPDWTSEIKTDEHVLQVNMSKNDIRNSPEYEPMKPINRQYEEVLYNYFGQPVYW